MPRNKISASCRAIVWGHKGTACQAGVTVSPIPSAPFSHHFVRGLIPRHALKNIRCVRNRAPCMTQKKRWFRKIGEHSQHAKQNQLRPLRCQHGSVTLRNTGAQSILETTKVLKENNNNNNGHCLLQPQVGQRSILGQEEVNPGKATPRTLRLEF